MRLNFKLLKYVVSTLNLCNKDVSFDFYLSHDMIRVGTMVIKFSDEMQ